MSFGDRIRFIRGKLRQAEFANLLGVHRNTVRRWESNERRPKGEIIIQLYELFNANLIWLISDKGEPYIDNSDETVERKSLLKEFEKRINGLEKQVSELTDKINDACNLIEKHFTKKMDM